MLRKIRNFLGKYKTSRQIEHARDRGMKVGSDFRCMGGVVFGTEPYLISIGYHVTLSREVLFITHDGGTWVFRDACEMMNDITRYGPICICDNCFIGARVTILPNVKIGSNCVIGTGSVVAKSIPANTVAAGIPAKPICTYDEYVKKCRDTNQRAPKGKDKIEFLKNLFSGVLQDN